MREIHICEGDLDIRTRGKEAEHETEKKTEMVVCAWVKTHERYRPCQDLRGFGRTDCQNRYPRCQLRAWALLSSVAEYLGLLFTSAVRSTDITGGRSPGYCTRIEMFYVGTH